MKNIIKPFVVFLSFAVILMSLGSQVGAQTDVAFGIVVPDDQQAQGNSINAVPGGPGFIMIHPTAFIPLNSSSEWAFGVGGILYNPGTSQAFYLTEVNIPHGATISKIVVYYLDNSSSNLQLLLARFGPEDGSQIVMGDVTSTGENPNPLALEDTSILMNQVDNQSYGYVLQVSLPGGQGSNLHLRGVRIDYSYPVNLPLIKR